VRSTSGARHWGCGRRCAARSLLPGGEWNGGRGGCVRRAGREGGAGGVGASAGRMRVRRAGRALRWGCVRRCRAGRAREREIGASRPVPGRRGVGGAKASDTGGPKSGGPGRRGGGGGGNTQAGQLHRYWAGRGVGWAASGGERERGADGPVLGGPEEGGPGGGGAREMCGRAESGGPREEGGAVGGGGG
jgi:hypothetical protein